MNTPARGSELIGRTLGEFVVREKLGEGGAGIVYLAEQPLLGREAVIKVLQSQLGRDPDATQRFLREAKLASRLDHPFSAHIYAFGAEEDGLLWIAMERVRGMPLDELLTAKGPLPLERFLPLLERIAEVVHSAHEQGIVHRDLKPANVMVLSRAGRLLPKLLDFGIAKLKGDVPAPELAAPAHGQTAELLERSLSAELTHEGRIVGSPQFMAPEQWLDASGADSRADIYALGALSYQALTGKPPFSGTTVGQLARAHAQGPTPKLGPDFPSKLQAALDRAMAKSPSERFGTALELAAALRAASGLAGEGPALARMDEALLQALIAEAPRCMAEAGAALDAAANARAAADAAWQLFSTSVRYLGLLALASRARAGPGGPSDEPEVQAALRVLQADGLSDAGWVELTRSLVRPFATRREVHPLPELVELFEGRGPLPLEELLSLRAEAERDPPPGEKARDILPRLLSQLGSFVHALSFLWEYQLVVPRRAGEGGQKAERWMGARRSRQPITEVRGPPLPPGQPVLVDGQGQLVVPLWPLLQVAEPSPGSPEELFLFSRRGRYGAKLLALPSEFERQDEQLWEWFRRHLLPEVADSGRAPEEERAPYRGLSAFTASDAEMFFGREREAEAFLNRLRVTPMLAVVGASGAGKSSFVQAGVVPLLPPSWRTITVRPGGAPLAALSERLRAEGIGPVDLSSRPQALLEALEELAGGAVALLVVDQFEELVTLCLDQEERGQYSSLLSSAARPDGKVRVVLTLRDDFLMRAQQLPGMRERLAQGLQLVNTPVPEELLRIVVEPARRLGYGFDPPELAEQMVGAVADQPGALALLSFTASKLWELRDRHFKHLTRRAYEALGGVGGALARHAEEMLEQMPPEEQRLVREAFRHLVTAEGTRAVLTRNELRQLLGKGEPADSAMERLIRSRLLVSSEGESEGLERLEVTHEALLSAWPRLVRWRQEDAESVRLRDQLRVAARQWDARGRPKGLLWRDEALAEYRLWRARYRGALTDAEEAFGRASLGAESRARAFKRLLVGGAMAVLSVSLLFVYQAYSRSRAALMKGYQEQGRQAYLAGEPLRALAFFGAAYEERSADSAFQFLLGRAFRSLSAQELVLRGHQGRIFAAHFSPDGSKLLTGGEDGTAKLWDSHSGALLREFQGTQGELHHVLFTPDGRRILGVGKTGSSPEVWDAESGRLLFRLEGHKKRVTFADVSPGGEHILTAGEDGTARLWDAASGALLATLQGHGARVHFAWFSADGRRCLTGGEDKTARVWEVATGAQVSVFRGHAQAVFAGGFSPDGKLAVTAGEDLTVAVWNSEDGQPLFAPFSPHRRKVLHLRLSPDGRWLVTASEDGTAAVASLADGKVRHYLRESGQVLMARFSPDGRRIATVGGEGRIHLWDTQSGRHLAALAGHVDTVGFVSFDPEGSRLASAGYDGTARLWDARWTPYLFRQEHADEPASGCLSGDGGLAAISSAREVKLWNTRSGELLAAHDRSALSARMLPWVALGPDGSLLAVGNGEVAELRDSRTFELRRSLRGHERPLVHGAFSPDGSRLATTSLDGTARLWDVESGALLFEMKHPGPAILVSFSRDGRRLATGCVDRVARVWDAASGQLVAELRGHEQTVNHASFSADGERLLTSSDDKTARVWNLATKGLIATLDGHDAEVYESHFSPDGHLVFTASDDGNARAYDAESGKLLEVVAQHGSGVNFLALSSDGARLLTGSKDRAVTLWDISAHQSTRAEVERMIRCHVPFRLEDELLLRSATDPSACTSR
ncbi:MAG: serine/threonine protein kinase [Myxococcales bacterium]|nr:serine/threonine protein kinase [Myxococcales bacterium]